MAVGSGMRNLVAIYRALGGGWEYRGDLPLIDPETSRQMQDRTNWGGLIEVTNNEVTPKRNGMTPGVNEPVTRTE